MLWPEEFKKNVTTFLCPPPFSCDKYWLVVVQGGKNHLMHTKPWMVKTEVKCGFPTKYKTNRWASVVETADILIKVKESMCHNTQYMNHFCRLLHNRRPVGLPCESLKLSLMWILERDLVSLEKDYWGSDGTCMARVFWLGQYYVGKHCFLSFL